MTQVWLVTGSSRGLGRAIVEAGLAAGNRVLATARDIESLSELPERYGDHVKLFALDVSMVRYYGEESGLSIKPCIPATTSQFAPVQKSFYYDCIDKRR